MFVDYSKQLLDPKWQKKRLEVLNRDNFTCQFCLDTETTLHIHHRYYSYNIKAWEYPLDCYKTACADCHKAITEHVAENKTEEGFYTYRCLSSKKRPLFIYSTGRFILKFDHDCSEMSLPDHVSKELVQFLINVWLKEGKEENLIDLTQKHLTV